MLSALIAVLMLSPMSVSAIEPVDEPVDTRPPIATNEFIPEERDLTDCIGVLERPGCGSEERGGWRQTLILVAIGGGLLIVFGNVVRGVRKNRGG